MAKSDVLVRFNIGKDFTEEQIAKWLTQLTWWIDTTMSDVGDPTVHAQKVMKAALNGTKINGEAWPAVSGSFYKRVKQLCGFDLESGVGTKIGQKKVKRSYNSGDRTSMATITEVPPVSMEEALRLRREYISDLNKKYPHLDNPVYSPKVEELAETIIKSRMISDDFMSAKGSKLADLSKIRESLHKQIGELMEFLEISPKQRVTKTLDAKNADVGSLIAQIESYGEVWQEYEKLDAIRELLQFYKMLKSTRPDGTPQLNDWELWHMTRNRPVHFTCKCGQTYELLGGFTPDEIELALLQANSVYGFGLEPINSQINSGVPQTPVMIELENITAEDTSNDEPDFTDPDTE